MKSARLALILATLILVLGCITISGVFAGDPAAGHNGPDPFDKWWNNEQLAKLLQLDDATIEKLEVLYLEHGKAILDRKADLEKNRMDVLACLEKDPVDTDKTRKEYQEVLQDRNAYYMARFDYVLAVRQLIGKDRYMRLFNYFNEKWGK